MGMEGFPHEEAAGQAEVKDEAPELAKVLGAEANQAEAPAKPEEIQKITRQEMENLVGSIELQTSPDALRRLKAEMDASGWDYQTESVQYREQMNSIVEQALQKADYTKLKEITDIFGHEALSEDRRSQLIEKGKEEMRLSIVRGQFGKANEDWFTSSMKALQAAGMSNGEISDFVYDQAITKANNLWHNALPRLLEIVSGLYQKFPR